MKEISLQQALDEFKTIFMPARNLVTRTRVEIAQLPVMVEFNARVMQSWGSR